MCLLAKTGILRDGMRKSEAARRSPQHERQCEQSMHERECRGGRSQDENSDWWIVFVHVEGEFFEWRNGFRTQQVHADMAQPRKRHFWYRGRDTRPMIGQSITLAHENPHFQAVRDGTRRKEGIQPRATGTKPTAPCVKKSGMRASQALHEVRQQATVAAELPASKTIFPLLRPDAQIDV